MAARRGRPLTGDEKKVGTKFWLEPSLLVRVKKAAKEDGVTASEWVGRLIKRALTGRRN